MTESVGSIRAKWWHAVLYAFLLIVPSTAVFIGNDVGATILAAVGAAAIILTRLPDVVSFSGFGMSAQLDKKIKEADKVIADLKSISLAIAQASFEEMASSGQRTIRLKTSRKFATRDKIIDSLKEMGIDRTDILKSQDVWIRVYGHLLLDVIAIRVTEIQDVDVNAVLNEMRRLPRDTELDLLRPDALSDWARRRNDDQMHTLADEYRLLLETGSMRNPDIIPFDASLNHLWLGKPSSLSTF